MNEIYVDMRKQNEYVSKYFNADLVSVEELIVKIEDLDYEISELKLQLKEAQKSDEEKLEEWKWENADNRRDELIW